MWRAPAEPRETIGTGPRSRPRRGTGLVAGNVRLTSDGGRARANRGKSENKESARESHLPPSGKYLVRM